MDTPRTDGTGNEAQSLTASTPLTLPEGTERPKAETATPVLRRSVPTRDNQHWLRRGICPDCLEGVLVDERCIGCGTDFRRNQRLSEELDQLATLPQSSAPGVQCIDPTGFQGRLVMSSEGSENPKDDHIFSRQDLLELHDTLCKSGKDLMVLKNQDYSGYAADPFGNFRGSEFLGIHPILGILLRIQDKFSRLRSFIVTGQLVVKDESVNDIFRDTINYTVLAAGMVEEARRLQAQKDSAAKLTEGQDHVGTLPQA